MLRLNNLCGIAAIVFLLISSALALSGCTVKFTSSVKDGNMIRISHRAASEMIAQSVCQQPRGFRRWFAKNDESCKSRLEPGHLIVTSFADIDNLKNSSTLGRIIAQQVGSGFASRGHPVIELLLRDTVYIGVKEGEFLLSRALKDLSIEHDAQGVIVGTYAIGSNNVFVTTKLIRASDSVVLASEDFILPLGPDVRKLVGLEEEVVEG